MVEHWINVTDLPAHGREFSFRDQDFWPQILAEFSQDYSVLEPFSADVTLIPQPEGILIRGAMRGAGTTSCHRCAEPARVDLDHNFDLFEAFEDTDALEGEDNHLRSTDSGWELNIAGLLREELLLALPEKILCADTCLGLCPQCGKNRNLEHCVCCNLDSQSPLARALQGVKIKTN